jgi:MEDS: MEthanogen/methylotroph, DcmR Sensory domain
VSRESSSAAALRPHRHVVQFYDGDEELAESAGDYLADAIAEGGAAVILATTARCAAFEARLAARGVDVAAARHDGTLVCLDAVRLARRLTSAGRVDRTGFDAEIRPAILAAAGPGGPVRVYGEVVAVLWAAGHVNAALELEGFWNELGREIPFSLYCGYPRESVGDSEHQGAVSEVCRLHTGVLGDSPISGLAAAPAGDPGHPADLVAAGDPLARAHWTDAARTFPGTRESPRAARVFVLEMLAPWRGEQLAADAALVVGELANNAVMHARSEFGVTLVLSGGVLRISVDDVVPLGQPNGSRWLPARPDHGLGVVAAISDHWGVEAMAGGKAVWAELPLPDPPTA